MAYSVTVHCYGGRLPKARSAGASLDPPYILHPVRRGAILNGLKTSCAHRRWALFVVHVRTNQVHIVFRPPQPEQAISVLKEDLDRVLNLSESPRARWSTQMTIQPLWSQRSLKAEVEGVLNWPEEAASVYLSPALYRPAAHA